MKLAIKILFGIALIAALNILFFTPMSINRAMPMLLNQTADSKLQRELCQTPVLWRIGELDPSFGLTPEQAEQTAHDAAQLWNKAFNAELFRYDSLDGFPINFRYDSQQQQLLQQALQKSRQYQTSNRLDIRDETLQQQQSRLNQRSTTYQNDKAQLDRDMAALQIRSRDSGTWGSEAYQQQQASLQQRQQRLEYEGDAIRQQYDQLSRERDYRNSMSNDRNIRQPKPDSAPSIEFGEMQITDGKRTMTIFAYKTDAALTQSIAHQFGHALGLGHNGNNASIMSDIFNPANTELSRSDISSLNQQCNF
ncbi:matrixin family metalloprotease [Rheinheimera gaetbuli]